MTIFFPDIDTLHQFTLTLDCHQEALQCKKCLQCRQFVSHGFVYKKRHHGSVETVGKRVFCSNRDGKSGCGSTLRLYLCEQIPTLKHTAIQITLFLTCLIGGATVQKAYQAATRTDEPRNAYRWLHKLQHKLIDYRALLVNARTAIPCNAFTTRTRRLQLLLPSIQRLFALMGSDLCSQYQVRRQRCFI